MKVLLISANTESINMPVIPSGLACVAAATSAAGHEIELLDLRTAGDPHRAVQESLQRFRPGVVGISVRNIDNQDSGNTRFLVAQVKDVVDDCRRLSSAPIVLGGAGYSIFPQSVLGFLQADMGIRGEGETAFIRLLEHLERGSDPRDVPGLHVAGQPAERAAACEKYLDSLPFPDARLWPARDASEDLWLPLQTRRGCPLACSYCSTPAIEGTRLRRRNPDSVARALGRYAEAGFRRIYFTDNTFNLPPSYALELCRAISARGLGISWRCILYPTHVDEELVREMARAGCIEVSIGFESGSEPILRNLNKRFTPADVGRTAGLLGNYGIRRTGFLLLGGPGETMETAQESLGFADSLGLEAVRVSVGIRIYANTPLAETARREGLIAADDDLLQPRFYLVPRLEDRLRTTVSDWLASHPTWMS